MAKSVTFSKGSTVPSEDGYVARVDNGKGYHDLIVHVNKNGKAIRINDKTGENRVFVSVANLNSLIAALTHIKTKNVKTALSSVKFAA